MRVSTSLLFLFWSALSLQTPLATTGSDGPDLHNANHIFNAIHSSARQWGSSLNHNGMSFFLARVPAGTQLYHGTWTKEAVRGLEWLAFEPEHAMIFAYTRGPVREMLADEADTADKQYSHPPRWLSELIARGWQSSYKGSPGEIHDEYAGPPEKISNAGQSYLSAGQTDTPGVDSAHVLPNDEQQPQNVTRKSSDKSKLGYLHTYVPRHDLRLLYVDGSSAGKTTNGTLDSQDMVLLNMSSSHQRGIWAGERERAKRLCNLTSTLWQGKIDGVLRMEAGFEIILCDFEKHLELADVMAVEHHERWTGFPGGWPYIKAVAQRYDGIGNGRIALDYHDFVSVFPYPDIDGLFHNDVISDYPMPRLQNVSAKHRLMVKDDVTRMILRKDWSDNTTTTNWQEVADMIVARYSKPLHFLHTDTQVREDASLLDKYLDSILAPFIEFPARNITREVYRCVSQYVKPLPSQGSTASLAHQTIHGIAHQICGILLKALEAAATSVSRVQSTDVEIPQAIKLVDDLVEYLRWTTWNRCGTCPDEEVCYIPMWPMGRHEDHAHPRCRKEEDAANRWDYWGYLM